MGFSYRNVEIKYMGHELETASCDNCQGPIELITVGATQDAVEYTHLTLGGGHIIRSLFPSNNKQDVKAILCSKCTALLLKTFPVFQKEFDKRLEKQEVDKFRDEHIYSGTGWD